MPAWPILLVLAVPASPADVDACVAEAGSLARHKAAESAFDPMIAVLERCAELAPADTALRVRLAGSLWRKAYRDAALPPEKKDEYVARARQHAEAALLLDPENYEASVLKGSLLLLQADAAADPERKKALREEAAAVKSRVLALRAAGVEPRPDPYAPFFTPPSAAPAPAVSAPADPPPTAAQSGPPPQRVGGKIREPKKIKNAFPRYPDVARTAGIQGVVILDALIGTDGKVKSVRVLRGIPYLDEPALEAVRKWEYTPTLLEGVPVPVIMTVTVNFRLSSARDGWMR